MDAHWGSEKPPIHPFAESRTFVGETPSLDPGLLEDHGYTMSIVQGVEFPGSGRSHLFSDLSIGMKK